VPASYADPLAKYGAPEDPLAKYGLDSSPDPLAKYGAEADEWEDRGPWRVNRRTGERKLRPFPGALPASAVPELRPGPNLVENMAIQNVVGPAGAALSAAEGLGRLPFGSVGGPVGMGAQITGKLLSASPLRGLGQDLSRFADERRDEQLADPSGSLAGNAAKQLAAEFVDPGMIGGVLVGAGRKVVRGLSDDIGRGVARGLADVGAELGGRRLTGNAGEAYPLADELLREVPSGSARGPGRSPLRGGSVAGDAGGVPGSQAVGAGDAGGGRVARAALRTGAGDDVPLPGQVVFRGQADSASAPWLAEQRLGSHLPGLHVTEDQQVARQFAEGYGDRGRVVSGEAAVSRPFSVARRYSYDELRAIDPEVAVSSAKEHGAISSDEPIDGMAFWKALRDRELALAGGDSTDPDSIVKAIKSAGERLKVAGFDAVHHEVGSGKANAWAILSDKGFKPGPLADDYVNVSKFSFADAAGEERLRATVEKVAKGRGLHPKQVVSWDETRRAALDLGFSAEDLAAEDIRKIGGTEALAIRNIVSSNIADMGVIGRQLDNPSLPARERELLEKKLNALDWQNSNLLEKFSKARTRAGRDLNNLKIVAQRSNDPLVWAMKARQHLGPEAMTPEVRAKIIELAKAGDREGFIKLVSAKKPSTVLEKLSTYFKANLLTNPLTHSVNVLSTAVNTAAEIVSRTTAGVLADKLMGKFTGQRTLAALSKDELREVLTGGVMGAKEGLSILRGNVPTEALAKLDVGTATNFGEGLGGKILNGYTRTVFGSLAAEERAFKTIALRTSIANQAKAAGVPVAEALRSPSEEIAARAIADAEEATFQDATRAGKALTAVRSALGPAGEFVIPFAKTPGAVATRVAEYSPIGLAEGAMKVGAVVRKALKGAGVSAAEQREAAKILGRGVTGSSVFALGMYLRAKGIASGVTDEQAQGARDMNYLAGTPDASIRVGDTWLSVGRMSPVGNILAAGATAYDLINKSDRTVSGVAGGSAAAVLRTIADQPFLTGLESVVKMTNDPAKQGARVAKNVAGGMVPAASLLAGVARGTDPYIRENENVLESVQGRIPGLSQELPPRLNQFGAPVAREGGLVDSLLNPLKRTTDQTSDPVIGELRRLGLDVGYLDRAVTVNGKRRELTNDEWRGYQEEAGQETRARMLKMVEASWYKAANDEARRKALRFAQDAAREKARAHLLAGFR